MILSQICKKGYVMSNGPASAPPGLQIDAIKRALSKHKALIVHFNTLPGMGDPHVFYPEDLKRVIYINHYFELCSSIVRPGDKFDFTKIVQFQAP